MPGRDGVGLSERTQALLRPGEALVFDWDRLAICCAAAGEVSLRRTTCAEAVRRGFRELGPAVYAHPRAYPHLAGRPIAIDCRTRLGLRRFTSDLPSDFGLRAVLGRAAPTHIAGGSR